MKTITLNAYAKLNLVLNVKGRRPDGFHELKTVFERISLHDTITLRMTNGPIRIKCAHPHVPLGPKNLVYRVAERLKKDFKIDQGVEITIIKRIPVAAGLAGGSSNAATVLEGLNSLWQLNLSKKRLVDYASEIGSDVAFFLYDAPYALGEGRGERIRDLKIRTKLWHVLVTPKLKVYTKDVFARLNAPRLGGNLKLTKKRDDVSILLPFLRKGNIYSIGRHLVNDLEPAMLLVKPHLKGLKKKFIDAKAVGVCFSGSGPSIFALAESESHALRIRAKFDKRFAQVFVVSTR